ncbi:Mitochondrial Rho GTPase [Meloidogyne graminicola]|uniref:Mitochondrial Rho GTPase 1 n=1 Tax=Meloidogyne graminicola TaxID=189291 RepID=A0A8S9ZN19_9BILA|nr:Mitochondrial Rho GTPase [Meloidogyne graminicola]
MSFPNDNIFPSSSAARFSTNILEDVRILIVGDEGVGKTSIIMALVHDNFCTNVPARCEQVLIPRDVSPDGVLTEIVDYSPREQNEEELILLIQKANVICVVYSVKDTETMNRVTSYWLPLIQKSLGGGEHNRSVLLAANKSDNPDETSHIDKMIPIMNDYLEIETVVECSAKIMKNISEIFFYAQKAVVYPFRPLMSLEEKKLSMKCQKALARIFKLSDSDNDGFLSDDELMNFQLFSFGVPLTSAAIAEVKQVISEYDSNMLVNNSLTLEGFLYLHQMFIQRGRHETVWTVLKKFGHDLNLQLRQDYLLPRIKIPRGCSAEPSDICLQFLSDIFKRFDEDCDECLSSSELQSLFSVCPSNPWTEEMLHSVESNSLGWITFNGYINLWTLNFTLNLSQALEHLAYLGFNVKYGSQKRAVMVTRDRKKDIEEKSTKRKVFKCHVIGPKGAGKTVFCRSFIGKTIEDVDKMTRKQFIPYTINSVQVKSEIKHLLIHEVDVCSQNELLSTQEKCADIICLLYDSSNSDSFAFCAEIYLTKNMGICRFLPFKREEVSLFDNGLRIESSLKILVNDKWLSRYVVCQRRCLAEPPLIVWFKFKHSNKTLAILIQSQTLVFSFDNVESLVFWKEWLKDVCGRNVECVQNKFAFRAMSYAWNQPRTFIFTSEQIPELTAKLQCLLKAKQYFNHSNQVSRLSSLKSSSLGQTSTANHPMQQFFAQSPIFYANENEGGGQSPVPLFASLYANENDGQHRQVFTSLYANEGDGEKTFNSLYLNSMVAAAF